MAGITEMHSDLLHEQYELEAIDVNERTDTLSNAQRENVTSVNMGTMVDQGIQALGRRPGEPYICCLPAEVITRILRFVNDPISLIAFINTYPEKLLDFVVLVTDSLSHTPKFFQIPGIKTASLDRHTPRFWRKKSQDAYLRLVEVTKTRSLRQFLLRRNQEFGMAHYVVKSSIVWMNDTEHTYFDNNNGIAALCQERGATFYRSVSDMRLYTPGSYEREVKERSAIFKANNQTGPLALDLNHIELSFREHSANQLPSSIHCFLKKLSIHLSPGKNNARPSLRGLHVPNLRVFSLSYSGDHFPEIRGNSIGSLVREPRLQFTLTRVDHKMEHARHKILHDFTPDAELSDASVKLDFTSKCHKIIVEGIPDIAMSLFDFSNVQKIKWVKTSVCQGGIDISAPQLLRLHYTNCAPHARLPILSVPRIRELTIKTNTTRLGTFPETMIPEVCPSLILLRLSYEPILFPNETANTTAPHLEINEEMMSVFARKFTHLENLYLIGPVCLNQRFITQRKQRTGNTGIKLTSVTSLTIDLSYHCSKQFESDYNQMTYPWLSYTFPNINRLDISFTNPETMVYRRMLLPEFVNLQRLSLKDDNLTEVTTSTGQVLEMANNDTKREWAFDRAAERFNLFDFTSALYRDPSGKQWVEHREEFVDHTKLKEVSYEGWAGALRNLAKISTALGLIAAVVLLMLWT